MPLMLYAAFARSGMDASVPDNRVDGLGWHPPYLVSHSIEAFQKILFGQQFSLHENEDEDEGLHALHFGARYRWIYILQARSNEHLRL